MLVVARRGQVQIAHHLSVCSGSIEIRTAFTTKVVPIPTGPQRQRILLIAASFGMAALVGQAQVDRIGVELQLTQVERCRLT